MSTKKYVALFSVGLFFVAAVLSASILSTGDNAQRIGGPHWGMGGVALFGILLFSGGIWKVCDEGDDEGGMVVMMIMPIIMLLIVGMVSVAAPLFV